MTEVLDTYTAGTSEDDFAEADLPDVIAGDDTEPAAPWGYTNDPETGERRPKKSPGRPRKPPGADELSAGPEIVREPDRAPQRPKGRAPKPALAADEVPMPKVGMIAAGINKMYRRAGKFIRVVDPDVGEAFIYVARVDKDVPEDERELTVGEAWENLARTNPRIRAALLKVIAGGDIGDLVMAHAPIGMALVMKPWIQRFIRAEQLMESFAEPDEDEEEGTALPGGLTTADMQEMQDLNESQMRDMARKAAAGMGLHVSEADIDRAMKQAGSGVPPAFKRQQPKNSTRAQRSGAR